MAEAPSFEDRVRGGLLGAAIGDALGLPFEGAPRPWMDQEPVLGMTGGGPHGQPPGTWSDDSSMLLSLADALCAGYDLEAIGAAFLAWWTDSRWTPHGRTFGFGHTIAAAMHKMMVGIPAREAGQDAERANANGSLMRTLPVALYFAHDERRLLEAAHEVSGITHAHPRSQMCCGIYCLVAARLLEGMGRDEAVEDALARARARYSGEPWDAEREHLAPVLEADPRALDRAEVRSDAYVVDTLGAALWALCHGESFADVVLAAVNLGGDTDTTGCVAGGLAGVLHGRGGLPRDWVASLARVDDILELSSQFCKAVLEQRAA